MHDSLHPSLLFTQGFILSSLKENYINPFIPETSKTSNNPTTVNRTCIIKQQHNLFTCSKSKTTKISFTKGIASHFIICSNDLPKHPTQEALTAYIASRFLTATVIVTGAKLIIL